MPPTTLLHGALAKWLPPNALQTPPLRLRERAWMQLLACESVGIDPTDGAEPITAR